MWFKNKDITILKKKRLLVIYTDMFYHTLEQSIRVKF